MDAGLLGRRKKAGCWLRNLEQRLNPDIIHLNGYAHASLPWSAPTIVVAHSCVFSWWEAVKKSVPPVEWDKYKEVVTTALNVADVVVAPTATMLTALRKIYGPVQRAR